MTRTIAQIRGVRAQLTVAINTSQDGAYALVDLKNARNLQEVCDQLIRELQNATTDKVTPFPQVRPKNSAQEPHHS